jgi:predicted CXXCH cytochrome family protein
MSALKRSANGENKPVARLALMAGAGLIFLLAGSGSGDIQGSKHDFTQRGWRGGDACSACHIPHADAGPKIGKWESEARRDRAVPYEHREGLPGPLSLQCLGCHDGGIATDTFADETADLDLSSRERASRFGDLSRNHPIGVRYPTRERTYQPVSRVTASDRVRLFDGKVECTSCHDPHDRYDLPYMLVMPNNQSQLCYTCHKL